MKQMLCKPATMDAVKEKKPDTAKAKPNAIKKKKAPPPEEFQTSSGMGILFALEPRIMFDGAAVATGAEVIQDTTTQDQTPIPGIDGETSTDSANTDSSDSDALWSSGLSLSAPSDRKEIVFIDTRVEGYQTLIEGIDPNAEVILLDPTRDGVEQIAEILSDRTDIDAIHLIAEGNEAELHLGNTFLTQDAISGQYADLFTQIGQSLSAEADLLIYGCNFGQGEAGLEAVETLAELTGADIAASSDRTGHTAEFGDWELEVSTGFIETSVVIGEATQEAWEGVLATYTVTNTDDSGAGSFRQAIIDANANSGTDTIVFNISGTGPHTIDVLSALPSITDTVLIDGWSEPDFSATPVIRIDGASAGAGVDGLSFSGTSDGSTVRGLMITTFSRDGILIQSGADNITLVGNWVGTTGTGSTGVGNGDDGIQVEGSNAIIGGTGANDRNVITNSGDEGIDIKGSGVTGHLIQGNYIGLDPDGATGGGNADGGIVILTGSGNTIGGTTPAARNVISNNYEGIEIHTSNNIIQGNYIGTDATGTLDRGNHSSDGIEIQSGSGNLIGGESVGMGNVIAFNAHNGVDVVSGTTNAIVRNSIYSNALLGINLGTAGVTANDTGDGDSGANSLQNFPVLSSAVTTGTQITITGTLNSTASTSFRIEFYANTTGDGTGYGEGQTLIGVYDVTTDGSGNASFSPIFAANVSAGSAISATVSRLDGGDAPIETSEFALNVVAVLPTSPGSAIWRDSGDSTPNVNDWDGTSFGTATDSANMGQLRIVEVAEAPTRDEKIVVGVDTIGQLKGEIWDGTTWTALPFSMGFSSDNTAQSFDVVYESQSGDAMVVWNNETGGTTSVSYRIWDGTTWSAEQTISAPDAGVATQLRLAANPTSDELVLIVSDDNTDEWAAVWDGSSWGNTVVLDTVTTSDRNEISVAFESQTGHAMVVYDGANNFNDLTYQTWNGTNWSGQQTLTLPNTGSETDAEFTTLASDPTSDRIAIGVVAGGSQNQVVFAVWDGSTWGDTLMATTSGWTGNSLNAAVAFESQSGDLLVTYGEVSTTPRYQTWSSGGGWSGEMSVPDIGAYASVMMLASNPLTNGIMLAVQDSDSDLHYIHWDGSAWGTDNEVSTNTGETNLLRPFTFVFDAATPNAAPVNTVPGAQVVAEDTSLAISGISVNDPNGNLSTVQLSVTNGTLNVTLSGAATISAGSNGTSTLTLSGTQADINATLASLIYQGTLNYVGADTLTVLSTDSTAATDSDTVAITVGMFVDTTSDVSDGDTSSTAALLANKGADGFISLREAIEAANNTTGIDTLSFNITDPLVSGAHTIDVLSALPDITDAVIIDGTSEPDYAGTPIIELDGSSAGSVDGLRLITGSDGSTIRGLVINQFGSQGIEINNSDGNTIAGNYIGTDVTGTVDLGNGSAGIYLFSAQNNIIGGTTAADRNLISGNQGSGILRQGSNGGNLIQGNYIGTDVTGTLDLGNTQNGIAFAGSGADTIGGAVAGAGNLISGNNMAGISIGVGANGVTIQGNIIGLNAAGTGAIANSGDGIAVGADNTQIGGTTVLARNVISSNTQDGINVSGASNTTIEGNYIGTDITGTVDLGNGDEGIEVLSATNTTIGGSVVGARNVIAGNTNAGIRDNSTGTIIQGNYIGVDATGTATLTSSFGIQTWSSSTNAIIGGSGANEGNVIGGASAQGIILYSGSGHRVQGNFIGTDATGTVDLGNGQYGIYISSSSNNLIGGTGVGEGNTIAFNAADGVAVGSGTGNSILGNQIYSNIGLGIDLVSVGTEDVFGVSANDVGDADTGPNLLQNYPVLTAVHTTGSQVSISGTLNSTASTTFRIEFYASAAADGSGYGEAERYLGFATVTTDGSGNATINETQSWAVASGEYVTATATAIDDVGQVGIDDALAYGNTSEFAQNVVANTGPVNTVPGAQVVNEDTSLAISGISIADSNNNLSSVELSVTNGTLNVALSGAAILSAGANDTSTLTISGTQADINATLASLTYQGTINFNGSDTLTVLSTDAGALTDTDTVAITVNQDNDAPVVTASGGTTSYTEQATAVVIDGALTLVDPDGFEGADPSDQFTAAILITGNYEAADILGFTDTANIQGNVVGNALYLSVIGGQTATVADFEAALRTVTFSNGSDTPSELDRTITFSFDDGVDSSNVTTKTVQVTAVNDQAVADLNGADGGGNNFATTFTEGSGAVNMTDTDATVSDVDHTTYDSLNINLAGFVDGSSEKITIAGYTFTFGTAETVVQTVGSTDFEIDFDGSGFSIQRDISGEIPEADLQTFIRGITYENLSGAPTVGDRTIEFLPRDGGALVGLTSTSTITVAAINDAPILTMPGGVVNYTENDPPTVIDATATVSDPDSANFATGTLTVDFTANGTTNDRLAIRDQGAGIGNIQVSGNNISYQPAGSAILIGTFTGGTDGSTPLVITLNAAGDNAAVQALMRNITYENVSENPSELTRTVRFVLTDGDGGTSAAVTENINVTAVNDAPVLDNGGVMSLTTITEDDINNSGDLVSAIIASAGGDRITDVDSGAVEGIAITGLVSSNGTWEYNTGSGWTGVGTVSDTSSLLLRATDSLRFVPDGQNADTAFVTFAAWDQTSGTAGTKVDTSTYGGTTAISAVLETAVISVTAVNDAPVNTVPGAQTVNEDTALAISGISVNDVDANLSTVELAVTNGTLSVTLSGAATISAGANDSNTLTLSGSQADINATLASLSYQGTLNYNGADTLTITSTDGNSATDVDTVAITVVATNDDPVLTIPAGTTTYIEGSYQRITPSASLTDVDSADFDGGQLTVTIASGGEVTDDIYIFTTSTVLASGSNLSYDFGSGFVLIGTISGGNGVGDPLIVDFNANATGAAIEDVIEQIFFRNTTDDPSPTSRIIDFQITDGDGGTSAVQSRTIDVTPVNDAPSATNLGGDSLAYTEGDGALVIEQGADVLVSDVDSTNFDTGTLTVSFVAGSDSAEDELSIRDQGAGIGNIQVSGNNISYQPAGSAILIGTFAGGTGGTDLVITLNSAADAAAVAALLENITYENTDTDNPTTGARTVRYVLTDGDGGTSANYDTTVTVSGANDVPVNTVPGAQTVDEDTPLGITGVSVNDVDGNLSTVQLSVSNGTLNVALSGTATISAGANGTNTLTLSGTQADINATLASLTYQGTLNFTGSDTLTIISTDAGALTDTDTMGITVTAVNDAPVLTDGGTGTIFENASGLAPFFNNGIVSDPDSGDFAGGTLTFSVAAGGDGSEALSLAAFEGVTTSGTDVFVSGVQVGTYTGGAGGTPLVVTFDANATPSRVESVFKALAIHVASENPTSGLRNLEVVLTDGDGGTSNIATASATFSAVNDDPTNVGTLPTDLVFLQDTQGKLDLSAIDLSDVDANGGNLTLTITSDAGHLQTLGGVGLTLGGSQSQLILTGSLTDLNNFLNDVNAIDYEHATPGTYGNDVDLITIEISDNGNTGSGGGGTITLGTINIDITAVNDAPVNTVPGAQTVAEDTSLALSGISVNDVDGNLSAVQLAVSNGTLNVTLSGAATISAGANGSNTLTLSGSQADINATLTSLSYQGILNYTGADTLTITSTDANSATDVDTVAITVTNVNDPATIGGQTSYTGNEGDVGSGTLTATDADGLTDGTIFSVTTPATQGTAAIDPATGAWTYTPTDPNWFGTDTFTVTVTDDQGGLTTQVMSVTLANVNDPATIGGQTSYTGNEGDVGSGTLTATDADGLTDGTIFSVTTPATQGTAAIDPATGAWTYTPTDPNWFGTDTFTVTVTDDQGGLTTQVMSVTLANVNDPATIGGQTSYTGNEGDVGSGTLTATDADGLTDGTIFSVTTPATQGTAAIDPATGAWTYTPTDPNWFGTDTFTVTVTDDQGGLTTQVMSVTLANVNDPATIGGQTSYTGNEGDVGSGTLTATDADGLTDGTIFSVTTPATQGTAAIDPATGAWTYTPTDPNWFGTDTFTVTVTDDQGGLTTQVMSVTLANVNDPATIGGQTSYTGNEGDVGSGTLTATDADGLTDGTIFSVTTPATQGTAAIDPATGAWTYTPTDPNWFGTDTFTVTVTDDQGGLTTQVMSVTLANVNDPATIGGQTSYTGNEGDVGSGTLTATDADGLTDGTIFSVTTPATQGTAAIDPATGAWTYTPTDPNWFGTDTFTVTVTDDQGGLTTQVMSVTLANVNDPATIGGQTSYTGNEGDVGSGTLTATDADGLTDGTIFSVTTPATQGTAAIDPATGAWTYTPTDPNWFGTDTFTVTVTDDQGGLTTQVMSVTLANVNDPATIGGQTSYTGNEGDVGSGTLTATDADGLTDGTIFSVTTPATQGTAAIDPATGAWTYTPTDPNWFGTDTFTVTVTDDQGGLTTQVMSVTLANVNDVPVAVNDSYTTSEDVPLTTTMATGVLANDNDLDGDTLAVNTTPIVNVTNGTLVLNADGSFTYTPNSGFSGLDTFTYQITDGNGGSAQATVTITIVGVNDAPVITSHGGVGNATLSLAENLAGATTMTATDVDGDPLTYSIVGGADAARFTLDPTTGALRFVGAPDFENPTDVGGNNVYDVQVQVSDDQGGTDTQSLAITVTDVMEGSAPPLPPEPTPEPIPEPTPEPTSETEPEPEPDPGILPSDTEITEAVSAPMADGGLASRGFEEEQQQAGHQEVVNVLDLPPFLRPASWATTSDQIRAYYPDPVDMTKTELSLDVLQQLNKFSDELGEAMQEQGDKHSRFVDLIKKTGLTLSAGLVAWLVRGGALVAGFMAALPAWRHFDPVPILNMNKKDKEDWTRRVKEAATLEAHEHHGLDQILQGSGAEESAPTLAPSSETKTPDTFS